MSIIRKHACVHCYQISIILIYRFCRYIDVWMYGYIGVLREGRVDGRMGGWVDGWMGG